MREEQRYVLWPVYFDRRATRKQGRRVAREQAVPNPRTDEVLRAARKAGLEAEKQEKAAYPGRWWQREGRILVETEQSKTDVIHAVAQHLAKSRES
ncbi:MAG: signal recognition particle subunit SRP19/SEC65 family protein [Thermoplasmatota archaeon]